MLKLSPAIREMILAALFFLAIFCLFNFMKVDDPDFWWHLKTGEYIYTNRALPESDPFSYAPYLGERAGVHRIVLTGYWLSQVLYYMIFQWAGFDGINIVKAMTYTLIFILQWVWMGKAGVKNPLRYISIALSAVIMLFGFPGERPQIYTFLFSVLTIYLLEDFGDGSKKIVFLPLVMLLWANMHGGFVVGVILLLVYLIVHGIRHFSGRVSPEKGQKKRFAWMLVSLAAAMINPNTFHTITGLYGFEQSMIVKDVTEYKDLFSIFFAWRIREPLLVAMGVLTLGIVALWMNRRKLDSVHVTVLSGVIIGGFYAFRLFSFTAIIGIPLIGIYFDRGVRGLADRHRLARAKRYFSAIAKGVLLVLSVTVIMVAFQQNVFSDNDYYEKDYPRKAVDFLLEKNIHGNIFNHYNWGGYLIWRLYPEYRVFIDGRGLSEEAYLLHNLILGAAEGKVAWNELLDSFGLNIILIPPMDYYSGEIFPIIPSLIGAGEWFLVYFDETSVMFVRAGPLNSDLLKIFSVPKDFAYNTVLAIADDRIQQVPGNPQFYIAKGIALKALGQEQEGKAYLEKAKEMLPKMPYPE